MTAIVATATFAILCAQAQNASSARIRKAHTHLMRGIEQASRAQEVRSPSRRLKALKRSEHNLRRARRLSVPPVRPLSHFVHEAATRHLVGVLNAEAAVYFERKSYKSARKRIDEVLKLDPKNAPARALDRAIRRELGRDIYERLEGTQGLNRVRDRREEIGGGLRDRGRSRRN